MNLRGVRIAVIVHFILLCMLSIPVHAEQIECGDWAGEICRDYGCQPIGCINFGGKITGQGLVMDQKPFRNHGFKFGEGPYKASFMRLDPGRYVISLQAMSRPDDRQEKLVRIKTAADRLYPRLERPQHERGKYLWNLAIEYDLEDQLGLKAHYEHIGDNVSFIDLRVVNPKKLAQFGFPRLQKNDTRHQLLYKGRNRWQLSSRRGDVGPPLVYEDMTWKKVGPGKPHGGMPDPGHAPGQVTGSEPGQPSIPLPIPTGQNGPLPLPTLPGLPPLPIPLPGSSQPTPTEPQPPTTPTPHPGHTGDKVTMERNVERPGGDYKLFPLDRGDPDLCAKECEQDPVCRAFTWYRPGLRGKKALCILKRKASPKKMKAGCYSGVKETASYPPPPPPPHPGHTGDKVTMERNVERPGGDYKSYPLDKDDPGFCARECEADPVCRAFTWYRPGLRGKKALCTLKRTAPPKKMRAGCYSGVKEKDSLPSPPPPPPHPGPTGDKVTMERNVERPGGDYKLFPLDKGDPGLCAKECEEDPVCRAFTYYRPGLRGKKALCTLKQTVPPKKGKGGCYSGVKETVSSPAPPPPPSPPQPGHQGKIKTLERNVERPGGDYKHFPLDQANPDLCVRACEQDPTCLAFTYFRPGLRGPKADCSLKNKVTPKNMRGGCYSGVKE